MFTLRDGTQIVPMRWWDDPSGDELDDEGTRLSRLALGEQFAYVFDLGDDWQHLCTVAKERVDPVDLYGIEPNKPAAYWGWGGCLPDQYGRRFNGDTGDETPIPSPPDPPLADLPPILPWWGPREATWPTGPR